MTPLKLLLVEKDASRAAELLHDLSGGSVDVFHVRDPHDAAEALSLKNFDMVLLNSADGASSLTAVVRGSPSAPMIVGIGVDADALGISASLPRKSDGNLAAQLLTLQEAHRAPSDDGAHDLATLDLPAFREQMGEDDDLIKEIVSLFLTESSAQVLELDSALAGGDFPRVTRVAHSLKGSLGSLYAVRSRYWADMLETSAAAANAARSEQCFSALRAELVQLEPLLRSFVAAQSDDSSALLH
jgi:HPt (histidine-containing phosphotransfer) domain-containing protein